MSQTRRLAAILAADVAGYSRLIGTEQEVTLDWLRSIRAEIIDPKVIEHRAASSKRPVMACWWNFLVWLMHCIVPPNDNTEWMSEVPPQRMGIGIGFRTGVHQGDIVLEDNDIFGTGLAKTFIRALHLRGRGSIAGPRGQVSLQY